MSNGNFKFKICHIDNAVIKLVQTIKVVSNEGIN